MSMLHLHATPTIPFLIPVLPLALEYLLGFTKSFNDMGHAIAQREPHLAVSKHMHMLYPIGLSYRHSMLHFLCPCVYYVTWASFTIYFC